MRQTEGFAVQVLWGHLYGVLIVGEPETVFAVTGSALIASGVVSLSLRPSPQKGAACEAAASCGDPATPPCRVQAGAAHADASPAALTSTAPTSGVVMPKGSPGGFPESAAAGGQRVGLGQRLRAWFAGRGRSAAQTRTLGEDAAEAGGLLACPPGEAKVWPPGCVQPGAPLRGSVLQGQWSGTAESADHVSVLVPP